MQEHELPTWQEMYRSALKDLDAARSALADAAGWLRSDWRPLGSPLPGPAGTALRDVQGQIGRLKGGIDQAKGALWSALDGHPEPEPDPSTEFAADILRRCRQAQQHGHPWPAWSTGEQLAVALVLRDRAHLEEMGYTVQEAAQRVHDGMAMPPTNLLAWLEDLRAELTGEHPNGQGGTPQW